MRAAGQTGAQIRSLEIRERKGNKLDRPVKGIRIRLLKILNTVLIAGAFAAGWFLYYAGQSEIPMTAVNIWSLPVLFLFLYVIFARTYDAFAVSYQRISEIAGSQILAALISDVLLYIVISILAQRLPSVLPMAAVLAGQIIIAVLWTTLTHWWYFKSYPPKRSAVIYDSQRALEELISEYGLEKKFDILWVAPVDDCLRDLSRLDGLETVFLSDLHSHDRNQILKYCLLHGVSAYTIPRIGDVLMSGAKHTHMFHLPILRVERHCATPEQAILKRVFDVLVSAVALIVLSPVLLLTALAVKLCDGGPVFYKQRRLTVNGAVFEILKFRSMRVDAEKVGGAQLSRGEEDPRITPVGRVIRRFRIDELPQLLNVLKGDMSIVGPRPERPEIAEAYEKDLPEFRLRLQVKAGLTGYAQVYGKYNTTPYDKLQMDLMYIANPSFLMDLSICIATVKVLFVPESTEGFTGEQPVTVSPDETEALRPVHKEERETANVS